MTQYSLPLCRLNPPVVTRVGSELPRINDKENDFCRDWLPKGFFDNPVIKAAWNDFLLVQKLALDNNEDE